jgi:alpha-galactosidase
VTNLPLGSVVETNAQITADRIDPLPSGALPVSLVPLVLQHCHNQESIIEAALSADKDLAFQAVCLDPTTSLDKDAAWDMFGQMLAANRGFIPFS